MAAKHRVIVAKPGLDGHDRGAKVVQQLRERGADDIVVFGGGIIPADDIPTLEAEGIEKVFTPGANTGDIAEWLRARFARSSTN